MNEAIYYLLMGSSIGWALSKTFPKNNGPDPDPEELEQEEDQYWEQVAEEEAAGDGWQDDGNVQPAWPDGFEIKSQAAGPKNAPPSLPDKNAHLLPNHFGRLLIIRTRTRRSEMNKRMIQGIREVAQAEARRIVKVRTETLKKQVWHYMAATLKPHIDPKTDEVNATTLAVEAAVGLDHPEWLDDEQHFVWDLAVDMAEAYEGGDDAE